MYGKDSIKTGTRARYQGLAEACKPPGNVDLTKKASVKAQKASRKGSLEPFNNLPLTHDKQNAWFREEKHKCTYN